MDKDTSRILQAISEMVQTEGWQYLKRDFGFVIDDLQNQINEPGGNVIKYSEGDLLKIRLRLLTDLLNYPDHFRALVIKDRKPDDPDPYNSNTVPIQDDPENPEN